MFDFFFSLYVLFLFFTDYSEEKEKSGEMLCKERDKREKRKVRVPNRSYSQERKVEQK